MHKVVRGSAMTFVTRLGTFAANLVMTILIARLLGPDQLGEYTRLILIPTMLVHFATPSIGTANVYLCGTGKLELDKIAGNSLLSGLVFGILVVVLYYLVSLTAPYGKLFDRLGANRELAMLAVLSLPFLLLLIYLRGMIRGSGRIAQFNLLISFVVLIQLLILIILYILRALTLPGIVLSFVLANALTAGLGLLLTMRLTPIPLAFDWPLFKTTLQYSAKAYLWNGTYFLDRRLDLVLLGAMVSSTALGYYATAVNIVEKLFFLPEAVATVSFPYVAGSSENEAKRLTTAIGRQVFVLLALLSLVVGLLAPQIIHLLFGAEFLPAAPVLRLLLWGNLFNATSRLITVAFAGRGQPEMGALSALVSVVVRGVGIALLVPLRGIVGAAAASSVGSILANGVIVSQFSRRHGIRVRDLFVPRAEDWLHYRQLYHQVTARFARMGKGDG